MSNREPEKLELIERIYWLIRLRWIAIVGVFITVWISTSGLLSGNVVVLNPIPLYIVSALMALYNLGFTLHFRALKQKSLAAIRGQATLQIVLDLFALTFLIHFAGGMENPFFFYFVFHMIIASILLSPKVSYLLAALATILLGAVFLLEYLGVIKHYGLGLFGVSSALRNYRVYISGVFFAFVTTIFFSVYFTTTIMERFRARGREIVYQRNQMEQRAKRLEEANQKLQEVQSQLVQSAKMAAIGQLAAGVAHELNNPIGGSLIYIQALLKKISRSSPDIERSVESMNDGAERTVDEVLSSIEKELNRCKRIISDLLVFSRKSEREIKDIDAIKILNEAIALIEHQTSWQNITIKRELDRNVPKIWADEAEIQQAFLNLLLNAVQAMEQGGTITVSAPCDSNDGNVKLKFSDTGVGIDEKDIAYIFDPFFTTKGPGKGTGLGLFVTFGIIKKYGGAIDVESKLGEGTSFTVTLPAFSG